VPGFWLVAFMAELYSGWIGTTRLQGLRWPSVSNFPGQSWFLTTCPAKNHSSPRMPICSVVGLCPRFVQTFTNCTISPYELRILMLTHRWPKISWDFIGIMYIRKNRWWPGLCPGPRRGSSQRSPRLPSWTLDGSRMWRLHPTTRTFSTRPGLRCPNYGHLIRVRLVNDMLHGVNEPL